MSTLHQLLMLQSTGCENFIYLFFLTLRHHTVSRKVCLCMFVCFICYWNGIQGHPTQAGRNLAIHENGFLSLISDICMRSLWLFCEMFNSRENFYPEHKCKSDFEMFSALYHPIYSFSFTPSHLQVSVWGASFCSWLLTVKTLALTSCWLVPQLMARLQQWCP